MLGDAQILSAEPEGYERRVVDFLRNSKANGRERKNEKREKGNCKRWNRIFERDREDRSVGKIDEGLVFSCK